METLRLISIIIYFTFCFGDGDANGIRTSYSNQAGCPDGWVKYRESCYLFQEKPDIFLEAMAPTTIVFTPEKVFHSFDDEDKYEELTEEGNHGDWYYYRRFKMLPHKNKVISRKTLLSGGNGKHLPDLTVFSAAIKHLKERLTEDIAQRVTDKADEYILWVLTIYEAPTTILFTPEKVFHSFEYEVEDRYDKRTEVGNHGDWYYYRRFKMLPHKNKVISRKTLLSGWNGKLTVFSAVIKHLKERLTEDIAKSVTDKADEDILWVLTIYEAKTETFYLI